MSQVGDIRENPDTGELQLYDGQPPKWTSYSAEGAGQAPFVGQQRYSKGAWQVFNEAGTEKDEAGKSFNVYRWQSVNLAAPGLLGMLAPYDGVQYRGDEAYYHLKGNSPDEWLSVTDIGERQVQQERDKEQQAFLSEFGKAPPGYVGDWPPRTQAGAINRNAAFEAIQKAETAQAKAQQDQQDREFSQANVLADNLRAEQEFAFRQQQANKPTYDDIILDALMNGQEDKARYFNNFKNQPSRLQSLQFAMQYAESPEEFDALFALAQGPAYDYGVAWMGAQQQAAQQQAQPNPFPAGSREARNFEAGTPAQQQQYNLRQQYLGASGGRLPGQAPEGTRFEAIPTTQGGPFQSSGQQPYYGPEIAMEGTQGPFRSAAQSTEKSGGLLAASPLLRREKERQDFFASIPEGTPKNRFDDPYKFATDDDIEMILSDPNVPPEEKAKAQIEKDRRKSVGAQQVETYNTKGMEASFADFMAGGPDLGDVTGQEMALAKAGSPYAGKVMATDPLTGQWTNWVDQGTGEVFKENRASDPNATGLSSTGVFNPIQKPQSKPTQGPFQSNLPSSIFSRRRKQEPRRVFGQPVFRRAV